MVSAAERAHELSRQLELHQLIGEIHADVRTLMEREKTNAARLTKLEQRTMLGGFVLAALMSIRDPSGLVKMLGGMFT